jgi:hypothetical protein
LGLANGQHRQEKKGGSEAKGLIFQILPARQLGPSDLPLLYPQLSDSCLYTPAISRGQYSVPLFACYGLDMVQICSPKAHVLEVWSQCGGIEMVESLRGGAYWRWLGPGVIVLGRDSWWALDLSYFP